MLAPALVVHPNASLVPTIVTLCSRFIHNIWGCQNFGPPKIHCKCSIVIESQKGLGSLILSHTHCDGLFCFIQIEPVLSNFDQGEHLLIRVCSSRLTVDMFVDISCQSDWRLFESGVIPYTKLLLCNWILIIPFMENPEHRIGALYISG